MILLKILREAKGLNQKQLAAAIGRHPSVLCQIEKRPQPDNRFLTKETVGLLEGFFHLPIDRLLRPVDYEALMGAVRLC